MKFFRKIYERYCENTTNISCRKKNTIYSKTDQIIRKKPNLLIFRENKRNNFANFLAKFSRKLNFCEKKISKKVPRRDFKSPTVEKTCQIERK